jgi:methionine biosynthesis protein MetW
MDAARQSHSIKRETDLQIMGEWIGPGSRVLDLGCGRGVLLEMLRHKLGITGLGVDTDEEKIEACVRRGVTAYQGDALELLSIFGEGHFDWVILSRTVQELERPDKVIGEALRVGKNLAVGFVNQGFWRSRHSMLRKGTTDGCDADASCWPQGRPKNPVSIAQFEEFCASKGYTITHRSYLREDWKTPVALRPSLLAAYAIYALSAR